MGVFTSYVLTSLSDASIPHLREPVENVFKEVMINKGLPTREDFRELRNRIDMLDYHIRESNKALNAVRAGCKTVLADVEKANLALAALEE
jgi:inorganic triphosphatase YgiF